MIEKNDVLFWYAESAIHAGDGASTGTVDLPIQRDPQTSHPIFRSGGVKGSIRDACRIRWDVDTDVQKKILWETIFGPDTSNASDHAGAAIFSDARLLLFPVRSLNGVTAWITCPLSLAFFLRDAARVGKEVPFQIPSSIIDQGQALVASRSKITLEQAPTSGVIFEEFHFTTKADGSVENTAKWLATNAIPKGATNDFWRKRLFNTDDQSSHLVILSDEDFAYFVQNATNIVQRISINHDTGTVKKAGLWTEESLPCDSLLYSVVHVRPSRNLKADSSPSPNDLSAKLREGLEGSGGLIQLGGNETVGQGMLRVRFLEEAGNAQP
jgi:CRISPR-associated protein Cmr4